MLIYSDKKQISGCLGLGAGLEGGVTKGHAATFGEDGYVYYLCHGNGLTGVYMSELLKLYTFKRHSLL